MQHSNIIFKYKLSRRNHVHDNNNRGRVQYRVGLSFELAFDTVIVEDVMHSGIIYYRPIYKKNTTF